MLTVVIIVGLILLLRLFGNLTIPFYGSELNLFTFGYLVNLFMDEIQGDLYWPRFDYEFPKLGVLTIIFILNFVFLLFNLKISDRIFKSASTLYTKFILKPLGIFCGVSCIVIYLCLTWKWG